jgi:hypothetical protein
MHPRLLLAAALTVACSCSYGSGRSERAGSLPAQRLEVQYRDQNGSDRITVITVPLRTTVTPTPPLWQGRLSDAGCKGQEGRTLNVADASAVVQIGPPCGWSDRLGPVSPDGRYLVAWQPADGAAADLHLIDLAAAPADLGPVPNARSADYIATWTNNSRLWYTSDQSPAPPDGRLWSFAPGGHQADSTLVRDGALIRSVRGRS